MCLSMKQAATEHWSRFTDSTSAIKKRPSKTKNVFSFLFCHIPFLSLKSIQVSTVSDWSSQTGFDHVNPQPHTCRVQWGEGLHVKMLSCICSSAGLGAGEECAAPNRLNRTAHMLWQNLSTISHDLCDWTAFIDRHAHIWLLNLCCSKICLLCMYKRNSHKKDVTLQCFVCSVHVNQGIGKWWAFIRKYFCSFGVRLQ